MPDSKRTLGRGFTGTYCSLQLIGYVPMQTIILSSLLTAAISQLIEFSPFSLIQTLEAS